MTSKLARSDRRRRFALLAVPLLGLTMISCGLVPSPQPTARPVVITVLVPAPTQAVSTDAPVTAAPVALLPTNTLPPPPPPDFPQVSRGGPNGDNQDNFRISLDFTPSYFLRVYVFYSQDPNESFDASNDGRDIQAVEFTVTSPDGGRQFYDHAEKKAGYCFFGGGEPDCNPWTMEGGRYVWKSGGRPVQSGKYGLTIAVTAQNGDVGTWLWNKQSTNSIVITVP